MELILVIAFFIAFGLALFDARYFWICLGIFLYAWWRYPYIFDYGVKLW